MTKRRAHAFVFWLLPILVLRALMPVGSMLDVSSGTPTVMMCSGDFYQAAFHSEDASVHNSYPQSNQHGDQHSVCPFAAALAAAPSVQFIISVDAPLASATPETQANAQRSTYGPSRINLTRGPPAFS